MQRTSRKKGHIVKHIKYPIDAYKATVRTQHNKVPRVPVLSSTGKPLMPCSPARARELVRNGLAVKRWLKGVFCIQLTQRADGDVQVVAIGVDPGSKMCGYSVKSLDHTFINIQSPAKDGKAVSRAIKTRAMARRNRRNRNTPCRPPRFNNRSKAGWVPPSTKARWQHIYNIVAMLCRLYPITHVVVEDVKAKTRPGKDRWNRSFSPLMAGKNWLYSQLKLLGLELHLAEGYQTAELRQIHGLKKNPAKLVYDFYTHAVDAWVLANAITEGHLYPDMVQLTKLIRPEYSRRQLHLFSATKNGIRSRYGGSILSETIYKGTLVKYRNPRYIKQTHLALVTGYSINRGYSLGYIDDGGRYTQTAKLDHFQPICRIRWLWQHPCSHKGYSSRRAYLRDIVNGPSIVTKHYL
jgi:hypothetical protein